MYKKIGILIVSGALVFACGGNAETSDASSTGGSGESSGSGGSDATGGQGGSGAETSTNGLGVLGESCAKPGQLACADVKQKLGLVCGADEKWETNTTCSGEEVCDSTTSGQVGTCQKPTPECTKAGEAVCSGTGVVECSVDLIGNPVDTCSGLCFSGKCGADPSDCENLQADCAGDCTGSVDTKRCGCGVLEYWELVAPYSYRIPAAKDLCVDENITCGKRYVEIPDPGPNIEVTVGEGWSVYLYDPSADLSTVICETDGEELPAHSLPYSPPLLIVADDLGAKATTVKVVKWQ